LPLLLIVSSSFAASPHFVAASAALDAQNNLLVTFHEAGLGNTRDTNGTTYQASADWTAVYTCADTTTVSVSDHEDSPKQSFPGNGTVLNQTLTLNPPKPTSPPASACDDNSTPKETSFSYTNVKITDTTNNVFVPVPGTFPVTLP
jgi:hypothetical protein